MQPWLCRVGSLAPDGFDVVGLKADFRMSDEASWIRESLARWAYRSAMPAAPWPDSGRMHEPRQASGHNLGGTCP
jgi:hypothetical protein